MVRGRCECGSVQYEITGEIGSVAACHCTMCRKTSGHFWAAATVQDKDIDVAGEVTWFASSDWAKRGFCAKCGSSLFYKLNDKDHVEVAAGSMDKPTGLMQSRHIFVADKGDYYELADGLPLVETY